MEFLSDPGGARAPAPAAQSPRFSKPAQLREQTGPGIPDSPGFQVEFAERRAAGAVRRAQTPLSPLGIASVHAQVCELNKRRNQIGVERAP